MRLTPAGTVLLLGACTLGDDLPLVPPPPPPPAATFRLEISPSSTKAIGLLLGSTLQLVPRIIASTGDTLVPSGSVSYASRAATFVSVDLSGRITAVGQGNSTIQASTVHDGQAYTDTLAVSVVCTTELRAVVSPVDPVLLVGQQFTPTISLTTCGGQVTVTNTFTWSAMDLTIVSVDPVSGETVGLRAGTTVVRAQAQSYGFVAGIQVTVH